jgi:hypothetical protein
MFFKQTSKGFIAMKNVESRNFDDPTFVVKSRFNYLYDILIFSRFCPLYEAKDEGQSIA